ncbi:uncharacterized protein LOC110692234 [Chenopodium quinoa]|uniref:uncharacterized protein LOC110692234 n=1 Tax=Chenopodium quinoa TaxID=63459 RepID=UPI000B77E259|nr:uncharacterized protein LOC110692234 [Chenopodium quinoa]
MFICLRLLRDGFAKGCRPMIGVDGCHLKVAYPGQILVAVAKDGNNNLFPLAWATVEAENKETMADVVPKAEKRFCVRHIWANFKLKFPGSTYKELFWAAARTTTEFNFKFAMDSIKELSQEAYDYLVSIPTQSWSRHACSSNCKFNMLLNNMCETFNAVIRPARDKTILTQMEWMRRIEFVARKCVVQPSRDETFEVQLMDDQECVDLQKETCTCYHWELTGIPCVHAYSCMMDMRGDIEAYVDPYYTMDSYRKAYEPCVQPMPGPKHWERVNMREPQPPTFKVQPGRPKSKKRKLEPGEFSTASGQPNTAKRKKQCNKCAGFGHYAKTCKKPAAPATDEPRPPIRPPSNTPWMVEERKKKEVKAAKKSSSQPKVKQQVKSKLNASSSQPATTSVQQPSHTGMITRGKLQNIKGVNLTQ